MYLCSIQRVSAHERFDCCNSSDCDWDSGSTNNSDDDDGGGAGDCIIFM